MTTPEHRYVKVHFELEVEGDWPPAAVESLWARDLGDGTVQVDNTPWFVRGVACGDIIATQVNEDGERWAGKVVLPSENCTIRLIVLKDGGSEAARQSVIDLFQRLGLSGEGIERFGMVALNVPADADLSDVQRVLDHGAAQQWWHMEEGCITSAWRAASSS